MPLRTKALNKKEATLKPTFPQQVPFGKLTSEWSRPRAAPPSGSRTIYFVTRISFHPLSSHGWSLQKVGPKFQKPAIGRYSEGHVFLVLNQYQAHCLRFTLKNGFRGQALR